MKTLIVTLFAALVIGSTVYAQDISNEEWRNMSKKERKEYRMKVRVEQQEKTMQILESRAWVLEAHTIQDRYGSSAPIIPSLNFVGVDGENSTVQLGSSGEIGWNGVGGITVEGTVRQYKLIEGKKAGSGANLRIEIMGVSAGHVSMIINVSADGAATAMLSDTYGEKLTYRGQIVPLSESRVYKGVVTY